MAFLELMVFFGFFGADGYYSKHIAFNSRFLLSEKIFNYKFSVTNTSPIIKTLFLLNGCINRNVVTCVSRMEKPYTISILTTALFL